MSASRHSRFVIDKQDAGKPTTLHRYITTWYNPAHDFSLICMFLGKPQKL